MRQGFAIDAGALEKGEKLFRRGCRFVWGAAGPGDMMTSDLPEIAFAGRSNVGKSSLINALVGRKALARASSTPGRTQQINFFELEGAAHLVDLPGYGYAVASREKIAAWNDLVRHYLETRRSLRRVCVLIDSRHGIKAADQAAMEMLDDAGAAYIVVLTKCDKMKDAALAEMAARIEGELAHFKGAFPTVYPTSTARPAGIAELRAVLAATL